MHVLKFALSFCPAEFSLAFHFLFGKVEGWCGGCVVVVVVVCGGGGEVWGLDGYGMLDEGRCFGVGDGCCYETFLSKFLDGLCFFVLLVVAILFIVIMIVKVSRVRRVVIRFVGIINLVYSILGEFGKCLSLFGNNVFLEFVGK